MSCPGRGVERIDGPVLGAEEEPAAVEQGRGLARRWAVARPADRSGRGVQGHDAPRARAAPGGENGHVDGARVHSRRGCRELAEFPGSRAVPGVLVDRAERGVVGELEDAFAVDDGRELEQRVAVVLPERLEGRAHLRGRREEAGVVLGVAVQRPGEAVRALLRQRRAWAAARSARAGGRCCPCGCARRGSRQGRSPAMSTTISPREDGERLARIGEQASDAGLQALGDGEVKLPSCATGAPRRRRRRRWRAPAPMSPVAPRRCGSAPLTVSLSTRGALRRSPRPARRRRPPRGAA